MSWIKLVVDQLSDRRPVTIIGRASTTFSPLGAESTEEATLAVREFLTRRGWKRQWGRDTPWTWNSKLYVDELWFHKKYNKPTPVWNPGKK